DNRSLTALGRLSTNINGFNLTTLAEWEHRLGRTAALPDARLALGVMGTGHFKSVRLRGEARWEVQPQSRFRSAELSAYWSASDKADWEGALGYDAVARRGHARISHIRRFSNVAAAASIEAGTDGSVAAGINLNFSLDSAAGGFKLTNQRLA